MGGGAFLSSPGMPPSLPLFLCYPCISHDLFISFATFFSLLFFWAIMTTNNTGSAVKKLVNFLCRPFRQCPFLLQRNLKMEAFFYVSLCIFPPSSLASFPPWHEMWSWRRLSRGGQRRRRRRERGKRTICIKARLLFSTLLLSNNCRPLSHLKLRKEREREKVCANVTWRKKKLFFLGQKYVDV